MNSQELKKLKKFLKPLIRECIKEAIFEEGVLSSIIREAQGSPEKKIVKEECGTEFKSDADMKALNVKDKEIFLTFSSFKIFFSDIKHLLFNIKKGILFFLA